MRERERVEEVKLMISTNGKEGRADIFLDRWYSDHGETTLFHLEEVSFRAIVADGTGFSARLVCQRLVGEASKHAFIVKERSFDLEL